MRPQLVCPSLGAHLVFCHMQLVCRLWMFGCSLPLKNEAFLTCAENILMVTCWYSAASCLCSPVSGDNELRQLIVSCNLKAFPAIVSERAAQEAQALFGSLPILDCQNIWSD